ncbi:MAG TPA: NfeD family protein [Bacteroidales bacterium]|nr:NfeD family protein [Bacteroidales bacterium]HNS46814.1 NfeD family protein [Bacteroidales bacterium]
MHLHTDHYRNKKTCRWLPGLLFLAFAIILPGMLLSQEQADQSEKVKVYLFDIKEQIAPPVWHKAKKAFKQAEDLSADMVIIHMNTYGGVLETADSLRTRILNAGIPVHVFIDNNAASAGALISIACDSIYMSPGANIGAATVVDQEGKPLPDKYQSYMRSMMRSTAEVQGRDPMIAQAMVDPRMAIPGITDTGQVLTFTSSEAINYDFCEGEAKDMGDVMDLLGVENYELIEQELKPVDKIIAFLVNPVVSALLIMLIIGGIYFELQTPGIGFPLAIAVLGALLYFAPLYLEGLAAHWEILIFIVGVVLLAIELFAIPGFGVLGISGIVLIVAGLALSMVGNVGFHFPGDAFKALISSIFLVIIASFVSLVISFYLGKQILTTTIFGHLALDTVQEKSEGYTSADLQYTNVMGKKGRALTILRPAGKVRIGDEVYDATALTGYIEKGEEVEVVKYETSQLFVRKIST